MRDELNENGGYKTSHLQGHRPMSMGRTIKGFTSLMSLIPLLWSYSNIAHADVVPPKTDAITPSGISIADKEFRIDNIDLAIGSLKLERFSQSPSRYWVDYSQFGAMMTSNFDMYVQTTLIKASGPPGNTIAHYHATVHLGNSAYGTYFVLNLNGGSIHTHSGDANAGTLAWSGTSFQFTDKMANVYTFTPTVSAHPLGAGAGSYGTPTPNSQRVDHINFADGRLQQFYYDSGQRLKLITDSSGYAILFDYGANGFVSTACAIDSARAYVTPASSCAGQPLSVSYQYGTGPAPVGGGTMIVLSGFTDGQGQTTSYVRFPTSSPSIACIVPPGQSACQMQLAWSPSGPLQQTLADGNIWSFYGGASAHAVNDPEVPADTSYGTTVTDPAGKITSYQFAGSSLLNITDANGKNTTFKWCCSQIQDVYSPTTLDGTMLQQAVYPEGNIYSALYGGPYNTVSEERMKAKPGTGLADQVVTYSYGATFASGRLMPLPTAKTDANHNTTNWTYTGFGAVATEMGPAPSSGAARPLKVSTYVQKYAYVLNSGGALIASGGPIWKLSTETECQTAVGSNSPVCDSSAPQRITTYEYGADGTVDNLLVRGKVVSSGGLSLRTCYGYDNFSNKIWETSPRAGLAVCS